MSDALLQSLTPSARAGEPGWVTTLRSEAADRLRTDGFPTAKTETWRFTPVKPVIGTPFAPTEADDAAAARAAAEERLGDDGTWKLCVVNGRPQLEAAGAPPRGVEVDSLARLLGEGGGDIEAHLGRHASAEHFAALNAAMFDDGVVLRVRGAVEKPVHLVHIGVPGAGPTAAYPRVLVLVDEAAELRLVESYLVLPGERHLTNAVTEVSLGAGAVVDHLRIQEGSTSSYHVGALAVRQDRDSSYASRSIALGGALCRLDLDIALAGEGASCTMDGVYHVGTGEHVDHHTRVDHEVPRCNSVEEYRGLVDGSGHAVFDGTVFVRRDAQHTSAHQQNHNLLLSDNATAHTKPHLEIDADDVSCSHGATIGALDDAQLFYLRARGVDRDQAEAILTFAFVKGLVDRIRQPAIADRLSRAILARLPQGDTIRDLA